MVHGVVADNTGMAAGHCRLGRLNGTLGWGITGAERRYDGARESGTGTFSVTAVLGRNPDGTCSESQEDEVAHVFIARLSGTAMA